MKKLSIVLSLLLILVGCQSSSATLNPLSLKDALTQVEDKETTILYFGYPGCAWCNEAYPVIEELVTENNTTVHYINTAVESEDPDFDADFEIFKTYATDYLPTDSNGEKAFYVPNIFFIKEGNIVFQHVGTVDYHDPYSQAMTDAQIEELKEIYQTGFDLIK